MKKILLIEDDPNQNNATATYLTDEGFTVFRAHNGIDGIQAALENLPDMILCDIDMPKLTGFEVYRILQENSDTSIVPFLFITAKNSLQDIRTGLQLGADDYITKPFDYEELLMTIRTRLDKREKLFRNMRESYKALLENSITGVIIVQNMKIVFGNQKSHKIFGYNPKDLQNLNVLNLLHPEDKEGFLNKINSCLRNINMVLSGEFRFIHREKHIVFCKMNFGITKFGGLNSVITNFIDTSENKSLDMREYTFNPNQLLEMEKALAFVEKNKSHINKEMVGKIAEIYRSAMQLSRKEDNPDHLTKREVEILQLLCYGLSSQAIADKLFLSVRTVDRHRANLIDKTKSKNTVDLVIYALKHNMVEIPTIIAQLPQ